MLPTDEVSAEKGVGAAASMRTIIRQYASVHFQLPQHALRFASCFAWLSLQ
jgi:hypothetical protein